MKLAQLIEIGVVSIMKEELTEANFDVSELDTNEKIMISYFTKANTFLPTQVWDVHIFDGFVCPEENQMGYDSILREMQNGINLNRRMSRMTKNVDSKDLMLYEWGIYHFHLGLNVESDGYIERTNNILYAYIENNNIYLIGVFPHGKWADSELIEVLHTHYPEAISMYKMQDASMECNFSAEDRTNLRKANINMAVMMTDGTTYLGPGWGMTCAGTSSLSTIRMIDKKHEFKQLENMLVKQDPDFCSCTDLEICRADDDIQIQSKKMNKAYVLYRWETLKNKIYIN